jgi:hypothetical protein
MDNFGGHVLTYSFGCVSWPGAIGVSVNPQNPVPSRWEYASLPAEPWLDGMKKHNHSYPSRVWGKFQFDRDAWFIPYWFLVLVSATLTAISWLPWWSKRFSLRTLLIATTLVAVVLGAIVYAVR